VRLRMVAVVCADRPFLANFAEKKLGETALYRMSSSCRKQAVVTKPTMGRRQRLPRGIFRRKADPGAATGQKSHFDIGRDETNRPARQPLGSYSCIPIATVLKELCGEGFESFKHLPPPRKSDEILYSRYHAAHLRPDLYGRFFIFYCAIYLRRI